MRILAISFFTLFLVGCGTTSNLRQNSEIKTTPDLSKYNTIVILDFADGTKKQNLPESAGELFAEKVSAAILATNAFESVQREMTDDNSIVLNGDITRYAEGNSALRALIGFGAGSSYFDAKATFQDSSSSKQLGEILVDKNSWALGGWVAASQTVETFMDGAAKKIADQLAEAKKTKATNEGDIETAVTE